MLTLIGFAVVGVVCLEVGFRLGRARECMDRVEQACREMVATRERVEAERRQEAAAAGILASSSH